MAALRDLPCLVVDCQSTGATPAHGVLLELGWCTVEGGVAGPVRAAWVVLPEGRRVPSAVREVTGYRDDFRVEAVEERRLWDELVATAADVARRAETPKAPTLIHYATFEATWLGDLRARLAPDAEPSFDVACLHAIARRLYPDLPRRGLRALSGFLGYTAPQRSRSPDHVAASAFVWCALVGELERRGVADWQTLAAWLAAPAPKRGKRAFPFGARERRALPDAPGVYTMRRSNGDVLYVGKAASVRKRIASHFGAGARATERALEMLTQVHRIDVATTTTALEAALVEADEIKRLSPPYNVHLLGDVHRAWFATRTLDDVVERPDETHVVGPLPSRWAVSGSAAILALVTGAEPTRERRARAVGTPSAFAPDEEAFALGFRGFVAQRMTERSRTAAGRLAKAARTLDRLERAEGLEERAVDAPAGWDEARVRRHVERVVVQGARLVRRGRWLCLLADATVTFREPCATRSRVIVLSGGSLLSREDLADDAPIPRGPSAPRSMAERRLALDPDAYDRLRVITTELKRVHAEGGTVAVALAGVRGRDRLLEGRAVSRLLTWL